MHTAKYNFRRASTVAVTAAFMTQHPASAAETEAARDWSFYGFLNFGATRVDDGKSTDSYVAENPSAPSRIGVLGQIPIFDTETVTAQFETGFGFTDLGEVSPSNDGFEINLDRTVLRIFEVSHESTRTGKVSFGQGSMASDGASGVDLSGTGLAIGPAIGDLGGGTEFLRADGTGSGVFVSDVFDDLDGPRRFRARYDTPVWNGFRVSGAYGQEILRSGNDFLYRDIALTYAANTETFAFEAATSYEWIDNVEERSLLSASLLHTETGLNATLASGANQIGEGRYLYTKLGLKRDLFRAGTTAVAFEYYDGDDFGFTDSQSDAVGLGLTQNIKELGLDLVAAFRRYGLSSPTADFEDITVTMIGARWRF